MGPPWVWAASVDRGCGPRVWAVGVGRESSVPTHCARETGEREDQPDLTSGPRSAGV